MAKAVPQPWTVEDFLAFEAEEPERYEFVGGVVRMMTGGSAAHGVDQGQRRVALNERAPRGSCMADRRRPQGRDRRPPSCTRTCS